jgi:hypothetical protein
MVSGTTEVAGSECGICVVPFDLPFSFSFYGQSYTHANLATNGNIQFVTSANPLSSCPPPYGQLGPAIFPLWDSSMHTGDTNCPRNFGTPCAIFTRVTGNAPSRTVIIEWRTMIGSSSFRTANFEVQLHESNPTFEFIYGFVYYAGSNGSIGVQNGAERHTFYSCRSGNVLHQGLMLSWNAISASPGYNYSTSTGSIVRGTALVANSRCQACVVPISLPFPFTFYGQTYDAANLGNQGNLQFVTANLGSNICPPPRPELGPAILPFWDVFSNTDDHQACQGGLGSPCGIYTSVSGNSPDRIFNIEWRSTHGASAGDVSDFEIRLYETTGVIEFVYSAADGGGYSAAVGVQDGAARHTYYSCAAQVVNPGMIITWNPVTCEPPTPTPTRTETRSPTPTPTPCPPCPPTDTPTSTHTPTPTDTPEPFCCSGPSGSSLLWQCSGSSYDYAFSVTNPCATPVPVRLIRIPVVGVTANGPWQKAGYTEDTRDLGPGTTIISGTFVISVPSPGTEYPWARTELLAFGVGWCSSVHAYTPAILRCGLAYSPTATVTPSNTPAPTEELTATPTVIATATPGATLCPVTFTDVHATDYFYEAVRALYCRGVISGYGDNTFRPYNNTTRGQLSKIIALAEGWPLVCPDVGHFSDVAPGDPFFCFVETAFAHSVISGYGDGTFRPGANVTRAQLCKIVVLAEGWTLADPPVGHFRDVAANDPFYRYVETAYREAIISGYVCGAGCLEFRPGNSATRGQICKIVFGAISGP